MSSLKHNNFLVRPSDNIWDVPVVLFCVWTVVLVVASLIVLSCLRRETKKFQKRLSKADSKEDLVRDIAKLDSIMARYVQQFLGQGILEKLANTFAIDKDESKIEIFRFGEEKNSACIFHFDVFRAEAKQWFATKVEELNGLKLPEKDVKRTILSAIRY